MSKSKVGFKYTIEHIRNGEVIGVEEVDNLIPNEGLNHLLDVTLKAGAANATWYVSLYTGSYDPAINGGATLTAATYSAAVSELTSGYTGSTNRIAWVPGTISAGAVSNSGNVAAFSMTATNTVTGGALLSASGTGSTAGTLISVVKFGTSKSVVNGDILNITAGITLAST
jgi:hypothetical protein